MGKVTVSLDRTRQGYTAYMPEVPGCFTVGDDMNQISSNLIEVIDLYKEGKIEDGEAIEEFLSEPLEFEYKMDIQSFISFYGIIKQSTIARLAGINSSLLRQYARGLKKTSEKQAQKIEKAIHQLGREL
ncbi:MAG: type II toxin-antitoxin system HicB family antitoxin, partial [Bacteroidia bacterium]|nr:type II toxin-antitoxin system HicB family antitoxin [Bacteroidia bacterium]